MSIKTILTSLATLTVVAFAAGSHAAPATAVTPDDDATSTKISVADLNTGGDVAANALLQRIRSAANTVCDDELNRLECIRDTVARAVATLDNPAVTALYQRRGGTPSLLAARNR